jgi:predicted AAA+ superfamily ATPase
MSAVEEPQSSSDSRPAAELTQVFEERAEHLDRDELLQWTAETPRDRELMKKLKGSGAKLLSGPRGSGKSTLLRKAYFELLDEGHTLPAYINFARSLSLEPLFLTLVQISLSAEG